LESQAEGALGILNILGKDDSICLRLIHEALGHERVTVMNRRGDVWEAVGDNMLNTAHTTNPRKNGKLIAAEAVRLSRSAVLEAAYHKGGASSSVSPLDLVPEFVALPAKYAGDTGLGGKWYGIDDATSLPKYYEAALDKLLKADPSPDNPLYRLLLDNLTVLSLVAEEEARYLRERGAEKLHLGRGAPPSGQVNGQPGPLKSVKEAPRRLDGNPMAAGSENQMPLRCELVKTFGPEANMVPMWTNDPGKTKGHAAAAEDGCIHLAGEMPTRREDAKHLARAMAHALQQRRGREQGVSAQSALLLDDEAERAARAFLEGKRYEIREATQDRWLVFHETGEIYK
jgi:hypothetical protein